MYGSHLIDGHQAATNCQRSSKIVLVGQSVQALGEGETGLTELGDNFLVREFHGGWRPARPLPRTSCRADARDPRTSFPGINEKQVLPRRTRSNVEETSAPSAANCPVIFPEFSRARHYERKTLVKESRQEHRPSG